jgi:hypothetical protein
VRRVRSCRTRQDLVREILVRRGSTIAIADHEGHAYHRDLSGALSPQVLSAVKPEEVNRHPRSFSLMLVAVPWNRNDSLEGKDGLRVVVDIRDRVDKERQFGGEHPPVG